jgi:integrase
MIDMAHAKDQVSIADGQITLYRRDDVKDPTWQCRIRVKGHRGYIRRTTGQKDLAKAEQAAWQILGELNQRTSQNLPLRNKNFMEVATSFLRDAETRHREGRTSEGRFLVVQGTLKRYLIPYFGRKEITLIQKKELMDYRKWRQDYWITGPGKGERKKRITPTTATLKQEWSVLRGVFTHAIEMGLVSPLILANLKHDKIRINKRPAFTSEEYKRLYEFMRGWVKKSDHPKIQKDRALLRDYVLIMANSGMRKGEARILKWRDVNSYTNEHGEWVTLRVKGKTGERLVVCQPGTERYFNRQRKRGFRIDPEDYVFCHKDGSPIADWTSFSSLIKAAGLERDTNGNKRSIYSLRHTYATLRLENGTNVYWLKQNMGTSVTMIERHYGQTRVLVGIEHETARRRKAPATPARLTSATSPGDPVPDGAVDPTPALQGDED